MLGPAPVHILGAVRASEGSPRRDEPLSLAVHTQVRGTVLKATRVTPEFMTLVMNDKRAILSDVAKSDRLNRDFQASTH